MEGLLRMDRTLFERINLQWTNSTLDGLMPAITDLHTNLFFLLAVMALLVFWVFKKRVLAAKFIVILGLSIGMADAFSYRVVKQVVERPRPSEANIVYKSRTYVQRGNSFPSNHTANMFAAATVLSVAFPPAQIFFLIIAALIGYSRIYVGAHFPFDVLGGAIIGIAFARLNLKLFSGWIGRSENWRKLFLKSGADGSGWRKRLKSGGDSSRGQS